MSLSFLSDIWLTACMGFLFAALIEFAVVNSFARTELLVRRDNHESSQTMQYGTPNRHKHGTPNDTNHKTLDNGTTNNDITSSSKVALPYKVLHYRNASRAYKIDYLSRIVFPIFFSIFNLIYWCFYVLKWHYNEWNKLTLQHQLLTCEYWFVLSINNCESPQTLSMTQKFILSKEIHSSFCHQYPKGYVVWTNQISHGYYVYDLHKKT